MARNQSSTIGANGPWGDASTILGTSSGRSPRLCEGCNRWFWPKKSGQRWHDRQCHGEHAMAEPLIQLICQYPPCGLPFTKTKHQIGAGSGGYHTIACANKARSMGETALFDSHSHGTGTEPIHAYAKWGNIGPCTEWTGPKTKDGYGCFGLPDRSQIQAHKHAWQKANGPVLDKLFVCHKCDNRLCIRLDHLFLGTGPANTQDMVDKDRQARGEQSGMAKMNDVIVRSARLRYEAGEATQQELADEAGVTQAAMNSALLYKTWKHLI